MVRRAVEAIHPVRLGAFAAVLVILPLATGCERLEELWLGPTLLRVGDERIRADDAFRALAVVGAPGEFPASGLGFEALRDHVLREAALGLLLDREAKQRGVHISEDALDAEVADLLAGLVSDTVPPEIEARFGSTRAWRTTLRERLRRTRTEHAVRVDLADGLGIPKEQVESALDRLAPLLRRPARVRLDQLYFDDEGAAREARVQLAAGAPFDEWAARQHGTPPEAAWSGVEELPWELERAVIGLEPGEISEVWASPLGWHIVRLVERDDGGAPPVEEALEPAEDLLRAEAIESRFRAWLGARADEVEVHVHDDAVAALRCCRQGRPFFEPLE